jgi:hypothetical protein
MKDIFKINKSRIFLFGCARQIIQLRSERTMTYQRPRGMFARTLLEKVNTDRFIENYDMSKVSFFLSIKFLISFLKPLTQNTAERQRQQFLLDTVP